MVRHTRVSGDLGIKDESVTSSDIKDYSISASDLGSAAITSTKINDKAITTAKGSPDFVDGTLIADKAIVTAHGSPNFVTTSLIGSALTQAGTAQTGSYWVYPVVYGAVPRVVASYNGRQGSYPVFVSNIKAGSCVPYGSPGGVLQILALGNR